MNFSRSTPAPKTRYQPRSGGDAPSGASFEVGGMKSAGVTTNAGSAADAVSTGAIYANLRKNAPKYDDIVNTVEENRMGERISSMNAEATMAAAGILDLLDQDVPPFIVAPAVTVTAANVVEGWMQSLHIEAPESVR